MRLTQEQLKSLEGTFTGRLPRRAIKAGARRHLPFAGGDK